MNAEDTSAEVPVILFPMGGCKPEGELTKAQAKVHTAALREMVRKHWNDDGVKAVVALLEMRAARLQGQGLMPGATAHDAGQGYEAGQCVAFLRMIFNSEEKKE
jgi:hypothetical protein